MALNSLTLLAAGLLRRLHCRAISLLRHCLPRSTASLAAGATDEIVNSWADGRPSFNHESVMFSYSTNHGNTWSAPSTVPGPGRGFYSAPAISPNGHTVYTANSWWLTPFQTTTANPRMLQNTFQVSGIGGNGAPTGWSSRRT